MSDRAYVGKTFLAKNENAVVNKCLHVSGVAGGSKINKG
jgi:hypothetical protein